MIKFFAIGGAEEIGANSYYLNISGTGIVLDCGIHPRKNGIESLPRFELLDELPVDFVIISHAHQDHIGSLPYLVQRFPHAIIFTTDQTKEIAELTLHNSVKILKDRLSSSDLLQPYNHEEIDLLVKSIRSYEYKESFFLRGLRHESSSDISITFYDAGHILGSAGIMIEHNGFKIFYTGDINMSPQEILAGADLPKEKVDVLIMESTYGKTDIAQIGTWNSEARRLVKAANKVISQGGSILIPVFALGKTQEMMLLISNLMKRSGLIETPIIAGGISKKISRRYDVNRFKVNRQYIDSELAYIADSDLYEVNVLSEIQKKSTIVLASSGMILEKTISHNLVKEWIKYKQNAVFIVGYMDPDTPGYRVANAVTGDEIKLSDFSIPGKVNCIVQRFYFPSHSNREELLNIVRILKPGRVVLVHGDQDAIGWMGMKILELFTSMKVHAAEVGKWIEFN